MTRRALEWRDTLRWLGRLVTIGLLGWIGWTQDWGTLTELISNRRGVLILTIGICSMLVGQVWAALRWLVLLRVENPTFSFVQAFKLTLISAFASLFLPTTTGGDVIRIFSLNDRSRTASISIVAIDRIISVASVIFLFPFSIIIIYLHVNPSIKPIVGLITSIALVRPLKVRSFFAPIISFLKDLTTQFLSWRKYPGRLALAFVLALGSNAFSWLSVWLLTRALNIQANYFLVIAAGVWIYVAGMLPIAINGLGIQEAGYVYFYRLISLTPTSLAATLGLLTRLVYILAILPGGIWLALSPEIRLLLHKTATPEKNQ